MLKKMQDVGVALYSVCSYSDNRLNPKRVMEVVRLVLTYVLSLNSIQVCPTCHVMV